MKKNEEIIINNEEWEIKNDYITLFFFISIIKSSKPFTIGIKEPTRRELEEADMEFSIEMSNCIKKGILTKAMLAKKYSDTGGLLAESDANKLVDLYAELADCEAEYTQRTLQNRNVKRLPKAVKEEIDDAVRFVKEAGLIQFCRAVFNANEFVFVH